MVRSLKLLGVELAPYVVEWGDVGDTKDVLLAQTQLFSGQYNVRLVGGDKMFSPYYPYSLFYGRNLQNEILTLEVDGVNLWIGFVRNVQQAAQGREITISSDNFFTPAAEALATIVATGVNPVTAMVSLLEQAGVGDYIERNSFAAAAGGAQAAGATVNLNYNAESQTTALSIIQSLSELASVSVFVRKGRIVAKAFKPYQGGRSECRPPITSAHARTWGDVEQASDNLRNVVTVGYGASDSLTVRDQPSIDALGQERAFSFDTTTDQALAVPDLDSAQYFAGVFLSRCAFLRNTFDVELGPEFTDAQLGDRHLITCENSGMAEVAAEVIETNRKPQENGITLKFATLN